MGLIDVNAKNCTFLWVNHYALVYLAAFNVVEDVLEHSRILH